LDTDLSGNSCKRASILWDWINGVPIERIEETHTANPFQGKIGYGDTRKFVDARRFHLGAAHRITNILFVTGGPTEESTDHLLRQLEIGLPAQALGLIDIPADLTRGDYLALLRAGIQPPIKCGSVLTTAQANTRLTGGSSYHLKTLKVAVRSLMGDYGRGWV
jgi:hypothetical protein